MSWFKNCFGCGGCYLSDEDFNMFSNTEKIYDIDGEILDRDGILTGAYVLPVYNHVGPIHYDYNKIKYYSQWGLYDEATTEQQFIDDGISQKDIDQYKAKNRVIYGDDGFYHPIDNGKPNDDYILMPGTGCIIPVPTPENTADFYGTNVTFGDYVKAFGGFVLMVFLLGLLIFGIPGTIAYLISNSDINESIKAILAGVGFFIYIPFFAYIWNKFGLM